MRSRDRLPADAELFNAATSPSGDFALKPLTPIVSSHHVNANYAALLFLLRVRFGRFNASVFALTTVNISM